MAGGRERRRGAQFTMSCVRLALASHVCPPPTRREGSPAGQFAVPSAGFLAALYQGHGQLAPAYKPKGIIQRSFPLLKVYYTPWDLCSGLRPSTETGESLVLDPLIRNIELEELESLTCGRWEREGDERGVGLDACQLAIRPSPQDSSCQCCPPL